MVLQEAGRDLRPDTIVPAPDLTSAEVAAMENLESLEEFVAAEDSATASAEETSAPAALDEAASGESDDDEKPEASPDVAS